MVSAVTGALGALKGPLHGGAPGPVLDMLMDIRTAENADGWVRRELAAGRRIMGFGHRVYKVRDPRAEVLAQVAEEMAGAVPHDRKLFNLAREVEETVLRVLDEVKPGRISRRTSSSTRRLCCSRSACPRQRSWRCSPAAVAQVGVRTSSSSTRRTV
jgi:hypothetical protein